MKQHCNFQTKASSDCISPSMRLMKRTTSEGFPTLDPLIESKPMRLWANCSITTSSEHYVRAVSLKLDYFCWHYYPCSAQQKYNVRQMCNFEFSSNQVFKKNFKPGEVSNIFYFTKYIQNIISNVINIKLFISYFTILFFSTRSLKFNCVFYTYKHISTWTCHISGAQQSYVACGNCTGQRSSRRHLRQNIK